MCVFGDKSDKNSNQSEFVSYFFTILKLKATKGFIIILFSKNIYFKLRFGFVYLNYTHMVKYVCCVRENF